MSFQSKTKFPCWVYLKDHPIQLQRCKNQRAWHYVRRHGWAMVTPDLVGKRMRALLQDLEFDEADAYVYLLHRTTYDESAILTQGMFYRITRGNLPGDMLTPQVFEQLSETFCVPMEYFYLKGIRGVPVLFSRVNDRRVIAQNIIQPTEAPGQDEYDEAAQLGRPVIDPPDKKTTYAPIPEVPHRVYHILYELEGAEQHRVHIIASTKKRAVRALRARHPEAIVLDSSSQKLMEGLIIENY